MWKRVGNSNFGSWWSVTTNSVCCTWVFLLNEYPKSESKNWGLGLTPVSVNSSSSTKNDTTLVLNMQGWSALCCHLSKTCHFYFSFFSFFFIFIEICFAVLKSASSKKISTTPTCLSQLSVHLFVWDFLC